MQPFADENWRRTLPPSRSITTTADVTLVANPEDVFHFLFEPKNINKWIENVEYLSHRPAGQLAKGSEVACNITFLGTRTFATYKILDVEIGTYYIGAGKAGVITYEDRFDLLQSEKAGLTVVRWQFSIQYPFMLQIGIPFIRDQIVREQAKKMTKLSKIFSGK